MDVGNIVRALLSSSQPADSKLVELKAGQVVRGVVLKMLADSEALMNIMGTTVPARLETPLSQGQSTLLQVQPESAGGIVVLKPLSSSSVEIVPESFPEVLKSVGLKDTAINRAIVKGFHHEGVMLTKEIAQAASSAIQGASSEGEEEAVKAAVVAVKRNLPVSSETVGALRTAMFGEGFDELLHRVADQARAFTAGSAARGDGLSRLAERALDVIDRKDALVTGLLQTNGNPIDNEPGKLPPAAAISATPNRSSDGDGLRAENRDAGQTAASTGVPASPRAELPAKPPLLALLQWIGLDLERQAAKAPSPVSAPVSDFLKEPVTSSQALSLQTALQQSERDERSSGAFAERQTVHSRAGAPPQEDESGQNALVRREAARQITDGNVPARGIRQSVTMPGDVTNTAALPPIGEATAQESPSWTESLKAALLQLQAAEDVPPALKEAAQQTVQWITGQQLLLASDRNIPFAYATMFIPLSGGQSGDGAGSASVHIQSRKGKRGEWDADNCRLWFDLRLAHMGQTCIDVQVTNKHVSLHIFNDRLDYLPWIEENKQPIEAALEGIGYRLASVRTSSLPEHPLTAADTRRMTTTAAAAYGGPSYKGVDVRV